MKNNKRKEEEEAEEVVFVTIADIGCGDGYWLEKISRWLVFGENDEVVSLRERARKRNVRFRFIGIDASKEAVRVAAKRMMITTTANEDERIVEEKVNGAEFFFADGLAACSPRCGTARTRPGAGRPDSRRRAPHRVPPGGTRRARPPLLGVAVAGSVLGSLGRHPADDGRARAGSRGANSAGAGKRRLTDRERGAGYGS